MINLFDPQFHLFIKFLIFNKSWYEFNETNPKPKTTYYAYKNLGILTLLTVLLNVTNPPKAMPPKFVRESNHRYYLPDGFYFDNSSSISFSNSSLSSLIAELRISFPYFLMSMHSSQTSSFSKSFKNSDCFSSFSLVYSLIFKIIIW